MQEELKPAACPFCGTSNARPFKNPVQYDAPSFGVQCTSGDCAICGPERESEAEAVAAWNRRTPVSGEVAEATLICGECGIDRLKSGCRKTDCSMVGTAYVAEAAQGIDHAKLAGERAAFEVWYTQNYTDWIPRSLLDTEEYGNLDTQLAWRAWQARGQQAGVPEGCVIAPKEPTEAMIHAAEDIPSPRPFGKVYRAMLAAIPGEAK